MHRLLSAGVAVGAALTLTLTGCSDDSGPKAKNGNGQGGLGGAAAAQLNAVQVFQKTSQRSGQVRTLKADMTIEGTSPQGPTSTHMLVQMRLRPKLALKMVLDRVTINGRTAPGGMQMVLIGNAMYMKSPALAGKTRGKPWLKLPLSQAGRGGQTLEQLLQQRRQVDPAEQAKVFTASKNAREVGKEQIDGVAVTHYTGSLTPEEALSKVPAAQRTKQQAGYRRLGVTKIDFEFWVDGRQLPRKMILKMNGTVPTSTTVVYKDYGKPVAIAPPPANLVAPLPGTGGPRA